MKKMVPVLSAIIDNNSLILNVEDNMSLLNIVAKEQMLVDSEQFSFVYILEVDGEYTYLALQEALWPTLKESLDQSLTTYLVNQERKILLTLFNEELSYLIENIKGNSNYGEEMVQKVEKTF